MASRLSGQKSDRNFSRLHCPANPRSRLEHKEIQTKYEKMTGKSQSHVRILINRTLVGPEGLLENGPGPCVSVASATSVRFAT